MQGIVFVAPLLLCSVLFARGFCSVFLPKGSTGTGLDMAVTFAKYFLPFILFNLVNNLFHSFYRGIAAMKFLVATTLIGSVSRIIATYFAVKYFAMNGVTSAGLFRGLQNVCFLLAYILRAHGKRTK